MSVDAADETGNLEGILKEMLDYAAEKECLRQTV